MSRYRPAMTAPGTSEVGAPVSPRDLTATGNGAVISSDSRSVIVIATPLVCETHANATLR
jgi:hypothetical protein